MVRQIEACLRLPVKHHTKCSYGKMGAQRASGVWPAAGSRTQFFHLLFTKPGRSLLVMPCTMLGKLRHLKSARDFHTQKPCLFIFDPEKKWRKPLFCVFTVLWMPHCMRVDRQLIPAMDMCTSIQNDSCMRVVWYVGAGNIEPLKGYVRFTMLASNHWGRAKRHM